MGFVLDWGKNKKGKNIMKTLIIYTSQTGFTKKYAGWIAEKLNADVITSDEFKKRTDDSLKEYDTIIYGGWASMGKIVKADLFYTRARAWQNKRLAVYCVGAADADEPNMIQSMKKVVPEDLRDSIVSFYCPGGLNYEKMNLYSKMMMKTYATMLKKDESKKELGELCSHSFDHSDVKYAEPIVLWAKGMGAENKQLA